jgi:hypothetical protein
MVRCTKQPGIQIRSGLIDYEILLPRPMAALNERLLQNPDVYYNHVPPTEVHAMEIRKYMCLIILGVSDLPTAPSQF